MNTIPSNNDKRIVWAGDIILVVGDALIALFVQDWFYENFYMTSGPQSNNILPTLMSIAVFLMTALYVYALLSI